ncbi:MAG: RNA polymerase factor sigma-54 [Treponemataceae bacterium]
MSGLNLNQNLSQQQKLSYKMIQSINLLSEPIDQLREKILQEVEKNPALEIVESSKEEKSNTRSEYSYNFFENTHISSKSENTQANIASDNFQAFLENTESRGETLREHLLSQLNILNLNSQENEIGKMIIQNLDKHGYHIVALESLFFNESNSSNFDNIQENTIHADKQTVQRVLKKIQTFDPIGVACKDMKESLLLQAKEKFGKNLKMNEDKENLNVIVFLEQYFHLLQNPRPLTIQKKLAENKIKTNLENIELILKQIRSLEPFPAREFAPGHTLYISPDVVVKTIFDDNDEKENPQFYVELVKTNLPSVQINKEFLKFQNENEEVKKSVQDARNFLSSIDMRNQTLQKTAIQIVREQKDFFEKGVGHIKPLRMKDVAEKIGVHETTVSRIANEKYLLCHWGLFEFKYFFSNAVNISAKTETKKNITSNLQNEETHLTSKEAIKQQLAKIIAENEKNNKKQLSDQKLAEKLAQSGINIARRTVAKYRSELNLNSSYDR